MVIREFVRWCETACAAERAHGAPLLAEAWIEGRFSGDERGDAEAALLLFLSDPSARVRRALAEAVAGSREAPHALIVGFCEDIDPIATIVAERSPRLCGTSLAGLLSTGSAAVREAIARRRDLPVALSDALAETGGRGDCLMLLENAAIPLSDVALDRIAARFGDDSAVRERLLCETLSAPARQRLLVHHAAALAGSGFLRNLLGEAGARDLVGAARERATAALAHASVEDGQADGFAEHLRGAGVLTPALLLRALYEGNVDFFAAALGILSGRSPRRVRAILTECRARPLGSLFTDAGLSPSLAPIAAGALTAWREAPDGEGRRGVLARILDGARDAALQPPATEAIALLRRVAAEAAREEVAGAARRFAA